MIETKLSENPTVSIVMPIRNEADFIERSLAAIFNQTYPQELVEIIISDGMSTDATRDIIKALNKPNIRLLDNPAQIAPTGLNTAIRAASGDIIIRIDGHAIVEPQYVEQCVRWLQQRGVACAGGAVESRGHGLVGEAIALAMSSPYGVGSSGFRTLGSDAVPQLTDTVPFGAYRREVFAKVGFFNEKMIRHQDYEFCYRLRQAGGDILLLPQVRAQYYVRSSLDALWRQYWQYGTWKGFFIRKHPDSLKLRHMVPPAFILALVLALISLFVVDWGFWFMVVILLLYSGFILAATVKMSQQAGSWRYAPLLPAILMTLHLSWGAGVWWGFFTRSI